MEQAWPDRHCQNAGTRLLIFAVDSQAAVQPRPGRGSQVTAGVSAIRNTPISATPPAGIAGSAITHQQRWSIGVVERTDHRIAIRWNRNNQAKGLVKASNEKLCFFRRPG